MEMQYTNFNYCNKNFKSDIKYRILCGIKVIVNYKYTNAMIFKFKSKRNTTKVE